MGNAPYFCGLILCFEVNAVLAAISESEGGSQAAISNATGIDRSTLSEMMVRLTASGLLRRRRTKVDTRAYAVRLTKAGHEAMTAGDAAARKTDEAILTALPTNRGAQLVEVLGKLGAAVRVPQRGSRRPRVG